MNTTPHYGPEGPQEFRLVGARTPSKEAPRFVRGMGQYVDDLRLPGCCTRRSAGAPTPTHGSSGRTLPKRPRCQAWSAS